MVSLERPSKTKAPPQRRAGPIEAEGTSHPKSPVSNQPSGSIALLVAAGFCVPREISNNYIKNGTNNGHLSMEVVPPLMIRQHREGVTQKDCRRRALPYSTLSSLADHEFLWNLWCLRVSSCRSHSRQLWFPSRVSPPQLTPIPAHIAINNYCEHYKYSSTAEREREREMKASCICKIRVNFTGCCSWRTYFSHCIFVEWMVQNWFQNGSVLEMEQLCAYELALLFGSRHATTGAVSVSPYPFNSVTPIAYAKCNTAFRNIKQTYKQSKASKGDKAVHQWWKLDLHRIA